MEFKFTEHVQKQFNTIYFDEKNHIYKVKQATKSLVVLESASLTQLCSLSHFIVQASPPHLHLNTIEFRGTMRPLF